MLSPVQAPPCVPHREMWSQAVLLATSAWLGEVADVTATATEQTTGARAKSKSSGWSIWSWRVARPGDHSIIVPSANGVNIHALFRCCEAGDSMVNGCNRIHPKRIVNIPKQFPNCFLCPRPTVVHDPHCLPSVHILVRALVDWPSLQSHRHNKTTLCVYLVLSCTLWPLHPPRDWAVSIGSYVKQDIDVSEASPRNVTFAFDGSRQKPPHNNDEIFHPEMTHEVLDYFTFSQY